MFLPLKTCKLLAVKPAFKECCLWLEKPEQHLIIWTDCKNVIYPRAANRLNVCQDYWSLFFGRFNFSISVYPCSRKLKPVPNSPPTLTNQSHKKHPPIQLQSGFPHVGHWGNHPPETSEWARPQYQSTKSTLSSHFCSFSGAHTARFTCNPRVSRTLFWLNSTFGGILLKEILKSTESPVPSAHAAKIAPSVLQDSSGHQPLLTNHGLTSPWTLLTVYPLPLEIWLSSP